MLPDEGAEEQIENAADETATSQTDTATQTDGTTTAEAANGSGTGSEANDAFAALDIDPDTRKWAEAKGLTSLDKAITKAYEQEKLVGGAIKVPGKDASDEELDAFRKRMAEVLPVAAPKDASMYTFEVPKDLPETIPYDEGRANEFKEFSKELGLLPEQAAKLHDKFIEMQVKDYQQGLEGAPAVVEATAKAETAKLEKLWGPVDSPQARQQAAFADNVLSELGNDVLAKFQKAGMIGPNKEMLDADLGVGLAKLGAAIYKEGDVIRGNAAAIGNPFEEGPNFNLTKAMAIHKEDPQHAAALMAAAGKKPSDFGLQG